MTSTESHTERVEVIRAPVARYGSPAQLIAPAIGFVFVAWGLINIGHSGFHPERVYQPHDALSRGCTTRPSWLPSRSDSVWRCSSVAPSSGRPAPESGPSTAWRSGSGW